MSQRLREAARLTCAVMDGDRSLPDSHDAGLGNEQRETVPRCHCGGELRSIDCTNLILSSWTRCLNCGQQVSQGKTWP
jgi:hypothetical protein